MRPQHLFLKAGHPDHADKDSDDEAAYHQEEQLEGVQVVPECDEIFMVAQNIQFNNICLMPDARIVVRSRSELTELVDLLHKLTHSNLHHIRAHVTD